MNGDLHQVVLARLEHLEAREEKRDDAQWNLLGEVRQLRDLMIELNKQVASDLVSLKGYVLELDRHVRNVKKKNTK